MRLLSQFPGRVIGLRRGDAERIIVGEVEILQALLKPQQVVDMREQGLIEFRGLLSSEIVARHAISLAGGVAQFQESRAELRLTPHGLQSHTARGGRR
jgi:hypothetical protein